MTPTRSSFILAFATIYLVWGSTYLGIRVAVESMPPFLMAGLRFVIAGILLLAFLRLRGPLVLKAHQWRDNAITGTLLLLGGNGLVAWAEQSIPSGITALIVGAQPFTMVLTEWAWKGGQRPNTSLMTALLLGFLGVAWLAAPWDQQGANALNPAGVLALLSACVFWSVGSIYSKHAHEPATPFASAGLQMLCGGVSLGFVAALRGEWTAFQPAQVSPASWFAFAYLITVGSFLGFGSFVWLMKHTTPARVSTYAYVNPVVAVILGWLILKEPIGARTLAASAVIVVAVAIVTVQKTRGADKPARSET